MKKLMASVLAAAMVLSLAACGSTASTSSTAASEATSESASGEATGTSAATLNTDTTTLYINLASEPDYLDPALNSTVDGACLAVNSFAGLLRYNAEGQLEPDVAAEMPEVSEDGLTYTFKLKETKWSNGEALTANDFVYSWNRAANPLTASDYGYLYNGLIGFNEALASDEEGNYVDEAAATAAMEANDILVGVEAVDDYTLKVQLVAPCPYFLGLAAFPTFFPVYQAEVEAANPDGTNPGAWCADAGFVSNGAFTCTEWKHDESMTYTKNENYWDAANVSIEKLQFMLSAEDNAIFAAYNAGDLDFIDTIPTDEISNLNGIDPEFYVIPNLGTYYVGFNVNSKMFEGKTPEQAAAVRKAVILLIDREYIVENIGQAGQEPANTFIPTGVSDSNGGEFRQNTATYTYPDEANVGYYSTSMDDYDANVAEATELLKSAGYEFDEDGTLSDATPLTINYMFNTGTGHQKVGEAFQQDMAALGIDVQLSSEEWNVFLDDRKAGNFDVAREGWLMDFDDPINMLEIFYSTSGNNDMQLGVKVDGAIPSYAPQNWDEYDAMIDAIKAETDLAKRADMMHQAEDMLMETGAVVPLYNYTDIYMQKSNVEGMYWNTFGYKYFMYCTKTAA